MMTVYRYAIMQSNSL